MSTLREQLERLTAARKTRIPPDALSTIEHTTEELKQSGIADRTLRVGQRAPEFRLSDADGKRCPDGGVGGSGNPNHLVGGRAKLGLLRRSSVALFHLQIAPCLLNGR